jgi:hypothetical protein
MISLFQKKTKLCKIFHKLYNKIFHHYNSFTLIIIGTKSINQNLKPRNYERQNYKNSNASGNIDISYELLNS